EIVTASESKSVTAHEINNSITKAIREEGKQHEKNNTMVSGSAHFCSRLCSGSVGCFFKEQRAKECDSCVEQLRTLEMEG
ncbi:MAG: hypothetical protein LUH53_05050, partial [Lachnospiraceae bacterium]|nr:hypothetical protein [Lachnospiraceae bacterium]